METKKYQLPKEFAEKWVTALWSGVYRQITGAYKKAGCFCAIGLFYEVNGFNPTLYSIDSDKRNPIRWELKGELLILNDELEKSFPEIADYIEANVQFN